MKTILLSIAILFSVSVIAQSKPTKFMVFSKGVNSDGSEITSKEGVANSTHSFYTYAIELESLENVSKFHIELGTDESNPGNKGAWVVPFDINYNSNGIALSQRGNTVYITIGHHENSTIYCTAKVEYLDGSTSANVVFSK